MFLVVVIALAVVAVPLAGGRIANLAQIRFRWVPALLGALAIQVVIVSVLPDGAPSLHRLLYIASYAFVGAFLVANRRIVGSHVVALGVLLNTTAIVANNGVMPASGAALRAAGISTSAAGFTNSTHVAHAHLQLLGDIFAIPKPLPLHNVFSIGDVCIVLGVATTIHVVTQSRLVPRRQRPAPNVPIS